MRTESARLLVGNLAETLHAATRLDSWELAREPRPAAPTARPAGRRVSLPPPPLRPEPLPLAQALLRRRSVRAYSQQPLPLARLAQFLDLGRSVGLPAASPGTAPLVDVAAFLWGVDGLEAGTYLHVPEQDALVELSPGPRPEDLAGGLFQREFATGAGILLLVGHLALASETFGPRGYRYLLMQAGALGEGFYLAGAALGLGVSGNGGLRESLARDHAQLDGVRHDLVWSLAFGWPAATGGDRA